jgi:hypothetical protein
VAESDDQKISQKIEEYAGLISKSLASKLVSTSSSLVTKNSKNLSFAASILSSKSQIFSNGRKNRTLVLMLTDGTTFSLVLFDSNATKYSHLIFGDEISIFDAYESGGELYLSTNGKIELVARKIISSFETASSFVSGSLYNFLSFVSLSDGKIHFSDGFSKCPFPLVSQNFALEKACASNSFALIEKLKFVSDHFELSYDSRIFIQKPPLSSLKITDFKISEKNSVELFTSSNKNFVFDLNTFLSLIGEKLPLDLSSENFLKLKKQTLLNSVIVLDSDGRAKQIRSD